jgi:hypothetical protein
MVIYTAGIALLSYLVAIVMAMLIEIPMANVVKLLWPSTSSSSPVIKKGRYYKVIDVKYDIAIGVIVIFVIVVV